VATFGPALTLNIPTGQTNAFTGFFGGTGGIENGLRLVKDGGGTFVTTTPSTYTGGTTVRRGTLNMQGWLTGLGTGLLTMSPTGGDATFLVNAASSTQAFTNAVTVNAGSGVAVVGSDNTSFTDSTPTTLSGAFTLNGPVTLRAGNAVSTRFTGGFNGSGDIAVVSPSNLARTAEFIRTTGVNTFGPGLSIGQNVTLRLGSGSDVLGNRYVPDATTVSFAAGSKLELNPEGTDNEAVNALVSLTPGAGVIETVGGNTSTFFVLTVGAGNGSGTFGGTIQQQAGKSHFALVKAGAGTQTLAAANAYTGSTQVNAGTLRVTNPSGSATGSGSVRVNAGGTLGGTGRIFSGTIGPIPVDLQSGSTVQAGGTDTAAPARTDVLTLGSGMTFDGAVTFRSTVGQTGGVASAGRIDMAGGRLRKDDGGAAVDLLTVRLTDDGTLDLSGSASYTITLLTYTGRGEPTGFANRPTGDHVDLVAENFTFSGPILWTMNDSVLSITFTPVPEPAGLLMCAAVAAAGWAGFRRRGRRSV
jgi:autotransporter-associated beta strand protein